uniref:Nuclear speckle splicing regulatory protein 1 n=1 Tax=Pelodiscus sinensis TaxID=13735 RepID=K7FP33_PELSI|nr:nuclear speckle splicing regulatory protein 1 [Pelodiscus sinensis]|eukprot:XP_006122318.1 nuclear speckle splicing regulatory protein 1 [Pelodiscus sinensis]
MPKKALQKTLILKKHSVFADDSEEETSVGESLQKEALKKQVMKQTKLEIQKALAEDSTVYEYDSIYDEMQQQKKESNAQVLSGKDDKKPKYIQHILKAAEVRKQEQEKRMEKKIQKEREMEGGAFDDKEAFVTSAYKKKLQERAEEEEREKKEAALEACLDVTKQKDLSGFYRHLLNQTVGEEEVPKCSLREVRIKEEKSTTKSDESNQRNKSPDETPILKTPAKEEDNPDADSDLESSSRDDDCKNNRTSTKKKEIQDRYESSDEDSKHHQSRKHSTSSDSSSEERSHHTKIHINHPRRGESRTGRRGKDDQHKERDYERRDRNQEKEDRHRSGDRTTKESCRKRDEQENRQRGKDRKERDGYDKEGRKEKEREDSYSEREREKERLRNDKDRYSDRERGEKCREKDDHLKEKREKDDKKYRDRKESSPRASEKDRPHDQERETKAKDRGSNDERDSCSERFPETKNKDAEEGQKGAEQMGEKTVYVSKFAKRSNEETVVSARDRYLARQMARVSTKSYIEKEED